MPMNGSQVRGGVDAQLTAVVREYTNSDFIGNEVLPPVTVNSRAELIIVGGDEAFQNPAIDRAPGADIQTFELEYSNERIYIKGKALAAKVPVEDMEEADVVPQLNLAARAVKSVLAVTSLSTEIAQARAVRNASAYATANKTGLSGSDKWSDASSNPDTDVDKGHEVIRKKIGKRGSDLALGAALYAVTRRHPKIVAAFQYVKGRPLDTADLAAYFGVKRVHVGNAVAGPKNARFDVWGNDAVLFYRPDAVTGPEDTALGFTYNLKDYPAVKQPWLNESNNSWIYPILIENAPVIADADAGYLIKDAI